MSYSITDFLGLKNVLCIFIEENSLRRVIKIETQPHEVVCPCCGRKTKRTGKRLNMYQAYSEVV